MKQSQVNRIYSMPNQLHYANRVNVLTKKRKFHSMAKKALDSSKRKDNYPIIGIEYKTQSGSVLKIHNVNITSKSIELLNLNTGSISITTLDWFNKDSIFWDLV